MQFIIFRCQMSIASFTRWGSSHPYLGRKNADICSAFPAFYFKIPFDVSAAGEWGRRGGKLWKCQEYGECFYGRSNNLMYLTFDSPQWSPENGIWIGASDTRQEGIFAWSDGSKMDYSSKLSINWLYYILRVHLGAKYNFFCGKIHENINCL